jgi:hypothetical protein
LSKSLRITCPSIDEIPSIEEIIQLVTEDRHVVLVFPLSIESNNVARDKEFAIERLSKQLPECFSIFDSGGTKESTQITVKKVIEERVVIENIDLFLEAIDQFCATANELITRLARRLNFPMEEVSENWRFQLDSSLTKGWLDDNWQYWFHGHECQFRNVATEQVVDVRLKDYGDKYALLDPYFLAVFVRTTPEEARVSELLKDEFHDTGRVLKILAEKGYL